MEINVDFPAQSISWNGQGRLQISSDGGKAQAELRRRGLSGMFILVFSSEWTLSEEKDVQLSVKLSIAGQSILSVAARSKNFYNEASFEAFSELFDWRWSGCWAIVKPPSSTAGRIIRATSDLNYLLEPSPMPIQYRFGYEEGGPNATRLVDLKHNITSPLYTFQGNMTVDMPGSDGQVITNILQKVNSPLSDWFRQDLRQVFHQSGPYNWETCLIRSGLADLHVSARWNGSVLDYYRYIP